MFITKYLIVKNICILYLLSLWWFRTLASTLPEQLGFGRSPHYFLLHKFPHFLSWYTDWGVINWILLTDKKSGTCTGSYWSFPLKLGAMCSTFSFVLIHLNLTCTLPEGGKMCLDAWTKRRTHKECLFTWFYFQIIEIKEIFEKIFM